jgi:beta-N-acetylhexosaminidase
MRQLMHSFHGFSAPDPILRAVRSGAITSFCLFKAQNVRDPAQVRQMNESLRQAAVTHGHLPPLIGIDQEGGQLIAIGSPATELPGNMALGAARSPQLAMQAGRVLARELLAMGINLNFAPSLDVNVNPFNHAIGLRAFGDDMQWVSVLGSAMIAGMQAEGVIATGKHFPGHGDTYSDTHHGEARITHARERLEKVELEPFRAAIRDGVQAMLSAHIRVDAYDETLPASVSPAIMSGLLRDSLKFFGLIITDALDMHALSHWSTVERTRMALRAGADIALMGHMPDQMGIMAALAGEENPLAVTRIQQAQWRSPRVLPSLDVVGCAEHQQIAQAIADHSITLVKDGGQLPLAPSADETLVLITVQPSNITPADTSADITLALADRMRVRHGRVREIVLPSGFTDSEIAAVIAQVQHGDQVIVGTMDAATDPMQAALVQTLIARGHRPIVAALRTPYDLVAFPSVETYLCTYGIRACSMEALARVLFGEIEAEGVLPCNLPEAAFTL